VEEYFGGQPQMSRDDHQNIDSFIYVIVWFYEVDREFFPRSVIYAFEKDVAGKLFDDDEDDAAAKIMVRLRHAGSDEIVFLDSKGPVPSPWLRPTFAMVAEAFGAPPPRP
jgi:hypothetical protein